MKIVHKVKIEKKDFNTVKYFLDYLENIDGEIWELIEEKYPRCDNLFDETEAFLNFLRDCLESQESENDYN